MRAYGSWSAMRQRCLNPKHPSYKNYGGRGISICKRWMSFEAFYADLGDKLKTYSLERVNVNGNYEPNNCKWIPMAQQAKNKRKTVFGKDGLPTVRSRYTHSLDRQTYEDAQKQADEMEVPMSGVIEELLRWWTSTK